MIKIILNDLDKTEITVGTEEIAFQAKTENYYLHLKSRTGMFQYKNKTARDKDIKTIEKMRDLQK